jgi:hypothetical protein
VLRAASSSSRPASSSAAGRSPWRLIADLLFGVPPHDPVILTMAATILLAFAAAANWFPARRAARVDPMRSLRAE